MQKVIIESRRDQAMYDYLVKLVGDKNIENALKQLAGDRKPYLSNLFKVLNVDVPDSCMFEPASKEVALKSINEMQKLLNGWIIYLFFAKHLFAFGE